ncbi:MAG: DUF4129 domain-containing protein [Chloroflexales bacterium]
MNKPATYLRDAVRIAALALALLGVTVAHAQPLAMDGYLRLLREAHAAAERRDMIGLEQVAPALVAVRSVAMPDGGSAPADNRWLAAALDTPRPDLPTITARLGALIDALAYPSGPPAADAEDRLRDILARPPFRQADTPRALGWIEQLLQWLIDMLDRTFAPVNRAAAQGGGGMAWILAAIGLLIVGVVLAVWLRGLRRALAPSARRPTSGPEASLSAGEAAQHAGELARAGDYRRAARMLYLSSLLWLDENRLLRYDRSLTNREYLDRLGGNPALRERLRPVVETFDRVWYGDGGLDAAGFAAYEIQVAALRESQGRDTLP